MPIRVKFLTWWHFCFQYVHEHLQQSLLVGFYFETSSLIIRPPYTVVNLDIIWLEVQCLTFQNVLSYIYVIFFQICSRQLWNPNTVWQHGDTSCLLVSFVAKELTVSLSYVQCISVYVSIGHLKKCAGLA